MLMQLEANRFAQASHLMLRHDTSRLATCPFTPGRHGSFPSALANRITLRHAAPYHATTRISARPAPLCAPADPALPPSRPPALVQTQAALCASFEGATGAARTKATLREAVEAAGDDEAAAAALPPFPAALRALWPVDASFGEVPEAYATLPGGEENEPTGAGGKKGTPVRPCNAALTGHSLDTHWTPSPASHAIITSAKHQRIASPEMLLEKGNYSNGWK